jgi:hypothetical protein
LADFLIGIDTIFNLVDPTIGMFNGVPYVIMFLMSTLGSFSLLLWGTSNDLIPFIPWVRSQMTWLQEKMKGFELVDVDEIQINSINSSNKSI